MKTRSVSLLIILYSIFSQAQTQPYGYWQQHVDYTIAIDVDVKNFTYQGQQTLVYTNHSPDTLNKVYYHLYYNAFQPDSEMNALLHNIDDPDDRMMETVNGKRQSKIDDLSQNDMGLISINTLYQDDKPLTYHVEGTILEVDLQTPIKPGKSTTLITSYKAQIPPMIRRSGHSNHEGIALSMAQWYPKLVEYDRKGWHTDPYVGREFYGVWGDYDVTISIDRAYVLGGTGYLQNPQQVGYGYENPDLPLDRPKKGKLKWHFKAPNVHDFTWVADPDFVHDIQRTKQGTTLHFLYQKEEPFADHWKQLQPEAVKVFEYYNELIGPYLYHQYSILQGGDGGMEYGMCTLVNGHRSYMSLFGTVAHEMAHAWFQFALATNEILHPWMDEGFTSFVETLAFMTLKPDFFNGFPFKDAYATYFYLANSGYEEPLTTHANHYRANYSYYINTYSKGSVFMSQLAYMIGWENLYKTLKMYYKQWQGKHPSPNDFIRVAEQVSGLHLGWYLNEFTQTTHTIDYAVKIVEDNFITLERLGTMPMPVDIQVTFADGTKTDYHIPLTLMRGVKPTDATILKDWSIGNTVYKILTDKTVLEVEIDQSQYLADIDHSNNVWPKDAVKK